MSSSPRRSTADPSFGNDPISDDQETMQDITITGESPSNHIGDPESPPIPSGPIVLDKSALRRYPGWITLVVASSVAYASLAVERVSPNAPAAREWSFAVIGITLIVSICVSGCFLAPDCNPCTKAFVSPSSSTGRLFELFLSMFMLILWCIGLPIIMNPSNFIAVGLFNVVNANLYIASWVCFACIVFIVGDLMGDLFAGPHGTSLGLSRLDPETGEYVSTAPFSQVDCRRLWETRRGKWFALAVITGIALSSSVRTFQAFQCSESAMKIKNTCIDSRIAISMTVLSGIISVGMVGISSMGASLEIFEKIGAVTTTIVWTIALGAITFGEGPGHSFGNLFFATWAGFITSVLITADCFRGQITRRALEAIVRDTSQIEMQGAAGVDDNDI